MAKDIVPISERSITEIPLEAIHTFRKDVPKQILPERFRILHNFVQIDSAARYCILVLIRAGYRVQTTFSYSYCKPYLNQNPRYTGYQESFYDEDADVPYWHEIQISPFTKEHHKRSLLLTFEQLGFTIGELQLWLEVQFKEMTSLHNEIEQRDDQLHKSFSQSFMSEHPDTRQGSDDFEAWCRHCYKNSPAQYWKHRKRGSFLRYEKGESIYNTDWTTFWTPRWYNWRDYLPYWFMSSGKGYNEDWHGRTIYAEYIAPQKNEIWFFQCNKGYYIPFLFVNPFLNLAQTNYVLSEDSKHFLQLNPTLLPQLPKEIKQVKRKEK